jgi:DNA polymerase I-like protein with 3'-5' exonuclease and polymerase domains
MRNALVTVDDGLAANNCQSHLVNVVHDEIQIDAIEDELPLLVENVPAWMNYAEINEIVPITTECEITRTTWADKEKYV